jgi:hypothetical protein
MATAVCLVDMLNAHDHDDADHGDWNSSREELDMRAALTACADCRLEE